MKILVDADACPAKDEIIAVCQRHKLVPVFVANKPIPAIVNSSHACMEVVPGDFDAADDWIITQAQPGDLVLTNDLLLAQRAVKNHAAVISFSGGFLTDDVIHDMVAKREINRYLREMSVPSDQPSRYGKHDRSRLKSTLHTWIEVNLRRRG